MSDNKVTLDQLDNSAVEAMSSSVGDVNMLNTENKTIVGALAEIVGKKEIANAIGEPLAETDKFTEMSSEINGLLSTFKTNMMNAGVVVEDGDKFKQLIDKVQDISLGIENTRNTLAGLMQEGGYDITGDESIDSLLDLLILSGISVSDVKQIACGQYHTFILKYDGSIWSCGYNSTGQLGLGDTTNRNTFTQVTTNINNDVKQVACGYKHTCILKNDGSIWSCGSNNTGQLGLGDTTNRNTFTQVTTNINNDVKQVACGYKHTCILKNDGSIWSCGSNNTGQLGLGDTTNRNTFTQVTTNINNDVRQIACGVYYTVILKNDGSVWSCGYNGNGNLGLADTTDRSTFSQVTTNINNDVKQIACGLYHTIILKNDGSLWSCGLNDKGQLGLNDTTNKNIFTQVTTNINNDVKLVDCGAYHTFILKNDGSLWSCGLNDYGQLGIGTWDENAHSIFTQVTTNINNDVKLVDCGYYHTFMIKNDGSIWCCGLNDYGQLGFNDVTNRNIFTQVTTNINNDVRQIACGATHTFIIKNDGSVGSCGRNNYGQLGFNDTTDRNTFTIIPRGFY